MNLVMVRGKAKPKVVHRELSRAIKEAERLCNKEGTLVFVFTLFNFVEMVNGKPRWGTALGGEKK